MSKFGCHRSCWHFIYIIYAVYVIFFIFKLFIGDVYFRISNPTEPFPFLGFGLVVKKKFCSMHRMYVYWSHIFSYVSKIQERHAPLLAP